MARGRIHIYMSEEEEAVLERYLMGGVSPYYRHAILSRISLIEHSKSTLRRALGDKLYAKAFSVLMHLMLPVVREDDERRDIPERLHLEVSRRLQDHQPTGTTEKEWSKVVDAATLHATELFVLADEFWNAKQMQMVADVATPSN